MCTLKLKMGVSIYLHFNDSISNYIISRTKLFVKYKFEIKVRRSIILRVRIRREVIYYYFKNNIPKGFLTS